ADCLVETGQAVGGGLPAGEAYIGGDEPGQRIAHIPKRTRRLHQAAQRERTREKAGRCHNEWDDDRDLTIARREPGELSLSANDGPRIGKDGGKAHAEAGQLIKLTAVECHTLDVVSKSHQVVAEVR